MFGYMSKKDKEIRNLKAMVKNRDILIRDLENNIELLKNNLSTKKREQLGLK